MKVQHFEANRNGRDFVVGDLHGCREMLGALLAAAKFDYDADRVFSVGDLIDRGPDSIGCISLLSEPWFFAVRGNHEDLLIRSSLGQAQALQCWFGNGGQWAMGISPTTIADLSDQLEALPLAITVGDGAERFNVLHAEFFGSDEELDSGEFSVWVETDMLWGRSLIQGRGSEKRGVVVSALGFTQPGLSPTFVGHSIRPKIQRIGSHIFIDTGSFLGGGMLTMVEPRSGKSYSVRNGNVDGDGVALLMNYRDETLLKLAYELDCMAQIQGICEGGRGEPMHSNQSVHGKGGAIKAHDVFFASGCRACHRAIDQGKDLSAEQRRHYWQIAHDRTMLALFERGYIRAYPSPTVRVAAPVLRIKHRPSKGRTASPSKCLPRRGFP